MTSPSPLPGRVKIQDLTHELVRDWFDSACIDATVDEDEDVFVVLDGFRMLVRIDVQQGMILVLCSIGCDDELGVDRAGWLEAVNRINRRALFVRAVLEGSEEEPCVHYEHEHFALDGIVTRRQLVKLVRAVKDNARRRHAQLHEIVA